MALSNNFKGQKNPRPKYSEFKKTLPDNLRLTKEKDYAMKRSWKDSNKPKNFDEAKDKMFFSSIPSRGRQSDIPWLIY